MANIGLISVDGHHFPNLALMRISAYHKARGDHAEWWMGDLFHYDLVYMSKVFSDAYSPDKPEPLNADKVIKGGTGYHIHLKNGKEYLDDSHEDLPPEIESMFPDYSIYPQYNFAVAMTSRGCPRGCSFCHVAAKEGRKCHKVADVSDFWNGQKRIAVLDPNITACKEKHDLFMQYAATKAEIDFNQGLDIRLLTGQDIDDLNCIRVKGIHFAWDNPNDDLTEKFRAFSKKSGHKTNGAFGTVYCLTNFNSTLEQDLYRIYTLRDLHYDPYVMVYDKANAPQEIKDLQRWCNNRLIFKSVPKFEDYDKRRRNNGTN